MLRIFVAALALNACTSLSSADAPGPDTRPPSNALDWLTGCWQSESGDAREVWSEAEDGYYFGYAVSLRDGKVVFFEQMRIDPAPMPIFNAYPAGTGPSAFPATALAAESVTFANPEHDYPQKIQYTRSGDALNAVISLIDDRRPGQFNFIRCDGG
ncbi:MAG: DUF6265 family protein [Pseudomonadota bacterium]